MVDRDKFFELFEYLLNHHVPSVFKSRIEENLKNFDYEIFQSAYNIVRNKENYTCQDWINVYNKYKDNDELLLLILKVCGDAFANDGSKSIYLDILNNMLKNNSSDNINRESPYLYKINREIINECLKKELSSDVIEKIIEITPLDTLVNLYYDNVHLNYSKEKALEINPENTKLIAYKSLLECKNEMELCLDTLNKEAQKRMLTGTSILSISEKTIMDRTLTTLFRSIVPVCYIQDIDYLNSLLDEFSTTSASGLVANAILNNVCLDQDDEKVQELFHRAFDYCDIGLLERCPKCVAHEVSSVAYDTLVEFLDNEFNLTVWGNIEHPKTKAIVNPSNLRALILYLCEHEMVDDATLTDLAHRIVDAKIKGQDTFTLSVFSHISNPDLMPLIDKLQHHNKGIVYERNPYIPAEMLIKRAEDFCKKIEKYKGEQESKISGVWYDYITVSAKKTTLSDKCYDIMFKCFDNYNFIADIICSRTTPLQVLDKMIDFCNQNKGIYSYASRTKALAKVSKLYSENKINDITAIALHKAIRSDIFYLNKDKDISVALDNSNTQYLLSYLCSLPKQENDINATQNTINLLNELLNEGYFEEREIIFFKRMVDMLEENLAEFKQDKNNENKANLKQIAFKASMCLDDESVYYQLPLYLDELNKYYDLCSDEIETEKNNIEHER